MAVWRKAQFLPICRPQRLISKIKIETEYRECLRVTKKIYGNGRGSINYLGMVDTACPPSAERNLQPQYTIQIQVDLY
jgi:hypothetical protein